MVDRVIPRKLGAALAQPYFSTKLTMQQTGDAALAYCEEFGWCVQPAHWPVRIRGEVVCSCQLTKGKPQGTCNALGKHPIFPWSHVRMPSTVPLVTFQWEQNPRANIAVLTGERSGVVVADIDPRHGGSLEALWALGWPQGTPVERTGGGGWHVYVACPDGGLDSIDNYAPGIEMKAEGKLVIAAPSRHPSGQRYAWLDGYSPWDVPVAPLPKWVLNQLRCRARAQAKAVSAPARSDQELARRLPQAGRLVDEAVERAHARRDGGRHHTLIWLGNRLAMLGLRDERLAHYLFDYQARVKGGWST